MYVAALDRAGRAVRGVELVPGDGRQRALRTSRRSRCPTLYVWSTGDEAFGRAAAEATAEWVHGPYSFEVLEHVSHWIPETAPERALRALAAPPRRDLSLDGPLIRGSPPVAAPPERV